MIKNQNNLVQNKKNNEKKCAPIFEKGKHEPDEFYFFQEPIQIKPYVCDQNKPQQKMPLVSYQFKTTPCPPCQKDDTKPIPISIPAPKNKPSISISKPKTKLSIPKPSKPKQYRPKQHRSKQPIIINPTCQISNQILQQLSNLVKSCSNQNVPLEQSNRVISDIYNQLARLKVDRAIPDNIVPQISNLIDQKLEKLQLKLEYQRILDQLKKNSLQPQSQSQPQPNNNQTKTIENDLEKLKNMINQIKQQIDDLKLNEKKEWNRIRDKINQQEPVYVQPPAYVQPKAYIQPTATTYDCNEQLKSIIAMFDTMFIRSNVTNFDNLSNIINYIQTLNLSKEQISQIISEIKNKYSYPDEKIDQVVSSLEKLIFQSINQSEVLTTNSDLNNTFYLSNDYQQQIEYNHPFYANKTSYPPDSHIIQPNYLATPNHQTDRFLNFLQPTLNQMPLSISLFLSQMVESLLGLWYELVNFDRFTTLDQIIQLLTRDNRTLYLGIVIIFLFSLRYLAKCLFY